jgi:transcriptional regulator with XRE-family HTH domain
MARISIDQLTPEQRKRFEEGRARRPDVLAEIERDAPEIEAMARKFAADDQRRAMRRQALLGFLRRTREKLGLSLGDVAKRGGFHPAALTRLETGEVNPTLDTLQRYAEALGVQLVLSANLAKRKISSGSPAPKVGKAQSIVGRVRAAKRIRKVKES